MQKCNNLIFIFLCAWALLSCGTQYNKSENTSSASEKKVAYFHEISPSICMMDLFDLHLNGSGIDKDTSWVLKTNSHRTAKGYRSIDSLAELKKKAGEPFGYYLDRFLKTDSACVVIYKEFDGGNTGLALYKKHKEGWSLSKQCPDFQHMIKRNSHVVYAEWNKSMSGKALIYIMCENVNGVGVDYGRQVFALNNDLSLVAPESRIVFELSSIGRAHYAPFEEFFDISTDAISIKHIGEQYLGDFDNLKFDISTKCLLNSDGSLTGLKFIRERGNGRTDLLFVPIIESFKVTTMHNDIRNSGPQYGIRGVLKNFLARKSFFVVGGKTLAYGRLQDTANVKLQGEEKLLAMQKVADEKLLKMQRAAEEANEFYRNQDRVLESMKSQQEMSRAVDQVNSAQGLCNYCSGKGCPQCGLTGRRQR